MYFRKIVNNAIVVSVIVYTSASAIASPNLNSFFSRPQFDLPTLLKDVKFGMSELEIQSVIPAFKQDYYFKVKDNEDIQVAKDMSGGSLYGVYIDLATDFTQAASFLQQKWGKAAIGKNIVDEREYNWLSAEKGIRAKLENQANLARLSYYQYIPIQTLFPKNVPSLPQPIAAIKIGSSVENIKKISPDFRDKEFPDKNWTDIKGYFDARIWYFSENKSTIDYLSLSFPNIENVRDILVKKWGKPQKDSAGTEYWKNDDIEYIDTKGNLKKGIFIIYTPQKEGFNHSLEFKSSLDR
jgi:hypothetical protein